MLFLFSFFALLHFPKCTVERAFDGQGGVLCDVGVDHGRFGFAMAEEFLDVTHIHAFF